MVATSTIVKYIQTEWALDGIEVKSVGDTSVTVLTPIFFDLSRFVLAIDDLFGGECDFTRENTDVEIQIYIPTGNQRTVSETRGKSEIVAIIIGLACTCLLLVVLHQIKHTINIPNFTSSTEL